MPNGTTVRVVEVPYPKSTKKDTQPKRNHDPHCRENLTIPLVRPALLRFLILGHHTLLLHRLVRCLSPLQARAEVDLHDVHGSEDDDSREQGICGLVEDWIFQVVVVARDEDGEGDEGKPEDERDGGLLVVRKCCVAHEAGGVDHGEFIDQLHGI